MPGTLLSTFHELTHLTTQPHSNSVGYLPCVALSGSELRQLALLTVTILNPALENDSENDFFVYHDFPIITKPGGSGTSFNNLRTTSFIAEWH